MRPRLLKREVLLKIEPNEDAHGWGVATFVDKRLIFRIYGNEVLFYRTRRYSDGDKTYSHKAPKRAQQVLEAWNEMKRSQPRLT